MGSHFEILRLGLDAAHRDGAGGWPLFDRALMLGTLVIQALDRPPR